MGTTHTVGSCRDLCSSWARLFCRPLRIPPWGAGDPSLAEICYCTLALPSRCQCSAVDALDVLTWREVVIQHFSQDLRPPAMKLNSLRNMLRGDPLELVKSVSVTLTDPLAKAFEVLDRQYCERCGNALPSGGGVAVVDYVSSGTHRRIFDSF